MYSVNIDQPKHKREVVLARIEDYLKKLGKVYPATTLYKKKPPKWFYYVLEKNGQKLGVWFFDLVCSVGTNKIHIVEETIIEHNLDGAIIVGNMFSTNTKKFVERINNIADYKIFLFYTTDILES